MKPRLSPMQRAVSPKPSAAMLPSGFLSCVMTLHRSFTMPVLGLACSQKYRKFALSISCRSVSSSPVNGIWPASGVNGAGLALLTRVEANAAELASGKQTPASIPWRSSSRRAILLTESLPTKSIVTPQTWRQPITGVAVSPPIAFHTNRARARSSDSSGPALILLTLVPENSRMLGRSAARKKTAIVVTVGGLVLVLLIVVFLHYAKPISLRGAVVKQDADAGRQWPITDVEVSVS